MFDARLLYGDIVWSHRAEELQDSAASGRGCDYSLMDASVARQSPAPENIPGRMMASTSVVAHQAASHLQPATALNPAAVSLMVVTAPTDE
jgi:hypothetical protein